MPTEEFLGAIMLVSGEEILSKVSRVDDENGAYLVLENPIVVEEITMDTRVGAKVSPWMKFSKERSFIVPLDRIITCVECDAEVEVFYNMSVDKVLPDEGDGPTNEGRVGSVEESRKISVTPDKNDKLLCRILKQNGSWGLLSKINKRPSKTLFMDIDLAELLNNIQTFFDSETDYVDHGVPFKMNFLFHGVPGTGKTSLIYTIASHFDLDICFLNITKDLDDNSFTMAITILPDDCILVLEDIDALFIERESKSGVSFSTVLNVLDGMIRKHKLLTFLTTNYKDRLDSALKRSGRIDYELEFSYATQKQTENMFKYFFTKDLDKFLKFTRKLKYTTSDLHKFLFKNRKTDDIMEHIAELEKICQENRYEGRKDLYS